MNSDTPPLHTGVAPQDYNKTFFDKLINDIRQNFNTLTSPGIVRTGKVNVSQMPTSATGLRAGDTWDDSTFVRIYTSGTPSTVAEIIADTVGAMVTGNTETGITVTYQDADNTIDFELVDEYIADLVGAMVTGNTETNISVTYQDSDNTLDFAVADPPTFTALTISGTVPIITITDTDTGSDCQVSGSGTTGTLTLSADENNEVSGSGINFRVDGTQLVTLTGGASQTSLGITGVVAQVSLTDSDDSSDSRVRYASPALVLDADFNNEASSTTMDFKIDGTLIGQIVAGGPMRMLGLGLSTTLDGTISGGVLTLARCGHINVDTEAAAATDDLDTITVSNVSNGDIIVLRSVSSSRDPTAKDGTGNLILAGDFLMSNTGDVLTLIYSAGNWREISRSDNA